MVVVLDAKERSSLLARAERAVMSGLSAASAPAMPADVIADVKRREDQIDEYFIRAAIVFMLERGQVEYTRDRKLVLASPAVNGR